MATFIRDMIFIMTSLMMFYYYLEKGAITQLDLLSFGLVFVIYVVIVYRMQSAQMSNQHGASSLHKKDEDED
jgi:Ca2+/Na+ antiporter